MADRKGEDFIPWGTKRKLSLAISFVLPTVLLVVKYEDPPGPLPTLHLLTALSVLINNPCPLLGFQQGQISTLRRVPIDRQQCCSITESWVDLEKLPFFWTPPCSDKGHQYVLAYVYFNICKCKSTISMSSSHLGLPLVHTSQPCT